MFSRLARGAVVLVAMLATFSMAHASVIVLTFEGLKNLEPIGNYYNGGFGGSGSGPGPNYGVVFGADSLALIDFDAGGNGNFANEPSPNTVAFFANGPGVVMNVPAGFTTGFSFFYSAIVYPGFVEVYDDLNATGNLLARIDLDITPQLGLGDPNGAYDNWKPVGVSFSGVAKSVSFSGSANFIGFDNITLGSATPGGVIPEPGSVVLFASGLGAALTALRRRKGA